MSDIILAYEQGYDLGFAGREFFSFLPECPSWAHLYVKAGWADGEWDRRRGLAHGTSLDHP